MAKKAKKAFAFLYGKKGQKKFKSAWFSEEWKRDMHASAFPTEHYRVRKVSKRVA